MKWLHLFINLLSESYFYSFACIYRDAFSLYTRPSIFFNTASSTYIFVEELYQRNFTIIKPIFHNISHEACAGINGQNLFIAKFKREKINLSNLNCIKPLPELHV